MYLSSNHPEMLIFLYWILLHSVFATHHFIHPLRFYPCSRLPLYTDKLQIYITPPISVSWIQNLSFFGITMNIHLECPQVFENHYVQHETTPKSSISILMSLLCVLNEVNPFTQTPESEIHKHLSAFSFPWQDEPQLLFLLYLLFVADNSAFHY